MTNACFTWRQCFVIDNNPDGWRLAPSSAKHCLATKRTWLWRWKISFFTRLPCCIEFKVFFNKSFLTPLWLFDEEMIYYSMFEVPFHRWFFFLSSCISVNSLCSSFQLSGPFCEPCCEMFDFFLFLTKKSLRIFWILEVYANLFWIWVRSNSDLMLYRCYKATINPFADTVTSKKPKNRLEKRFIYPATSFFDSSPTCIH